MHVTWNLRNMELPERLKAEAERKIAKLAERLNSFDADLLNLVITVEEVGGKGQYSCNLNLHLPQKTLHAEEVRSEKRSAINAAFEDLLRQEAKLMSKLRREESWQREARAGKATETGEE
jgi:ribosomal subunit interface protein